MSDNSALSALTAAISQIFQRGFRIDSQIRAFIETACLEQDAQCVLTSAQDSERETLLALLFSPDEEDCLNIEKILAAPATITQAEEAALAENLSAIFQEVSIILPEQSRQFSITVSPDHISAYIRGLKLQYRLSPQAAAAIAQYVTAEIQAMVTMRLRHAGFHGSPAQTRCLCRFLAQTGRSQRRFWEWFDYFLPFLTTLSAETDVSTALAERKQALSEHWYRLADISERMGSQPMELLLLQGLRLPGRSVDSLRQEIALVDEIIQLIAHLSSNS